MTLSKTLNHLKRTLVLSLTILMLANPLSSCGRNSIPEDTASETEKLTTEMSVEMTSEEETVSEPEISEESTEETTEETTEESTEPETTVEETSYTTLEGAYSPNANISENGTAPLALMYHLILDEPYTSLTGLFVRPSELEGHIQALIEKGYTFIFADEYGYYDNKTVIMSFDDGYIDNYEEMFPIIQKYNVKVTVFMVAGYINGANYLSEDMIREMASSGLVSFQAHTYNHVGLTSQSPDGMRNEFDSTNKTLESLTGRDVTALCYPSGQFNDSVVAVAGEYYKYAYTTVSTVSTAGYGLLTLPRLRVNRGLSKEAFSSLIP